MGKYALLLKQMLKECPQSDNESVDLKVKKSFSFLKTKINPKQDKLAINKTIFTNKHSRSLAKGPQVSRGPLKLIFHAT